MVAATKMATLRTDSKASAVVAATSTASRARIRRLAIRKPASVISITAKPRTSSWWKSGDCHSRISACWAGEERVSAA